MNAKASKKNYILINRIGQTTRNVGAAIKLMGLDYIKNFFNIFFGFAFPFLLFAIISTVINSAFASSKNSSVVPAIITFGGISFSAITYICISTLAVTLIGFRKSTLFKSIRVTPLRIGEMLTGIVVVYSLGALVSASTVWLWLWVFNGSDISNSNYLYHFNFGIYLSALLLYLWLTCAIGFLLSALVNTVVGGNSVGLLVYILIAFLSGQYFPVTQIDSNKSLKTVSAIFPQRHVYDLFMYGINAHYNPKYLLWNNQFWAVYTYPLLFTIALTIIVVLLYNNKSKNT